MARTTAPLLSFGASGAIAKTQVYAQWKGRPYARRYVIPSNPNSVGQQETRSTFKTLVQIFKRAPANMYAAFAAYGQISQFTAANGFVKQNLSMLRSDTVLTDMVFSPGTAAGFPPATIVVTPGNDQLTVDLTAQPLPTGWTITRAVMVAIKQQDPQSVTDFVVHEVTDVAAPYSQVITGLANAATYVVGGWFEYLRPDGKIAYGPSINTTGLTT